jgi:hypothetical protein
MSLANLVVAACAYEDAWNAFRDADLDLEGAFQRRRELAHMDLLGAVRAFRATSQVLLDATLPGV